MIPGMQKPATCASGCHGTAVAGIAAAEGFNQGIGIVGVAPSAKLIGYRKLLCSPPEDPCIYILPFNRDFYKGIFTGGDETKIDI
ncbi:MAG: S8 family serine peptidase [Candidatus Vecturithrix sp.]|nr:S8 family serine peptidase [Candidatus Vecturithrix sp.]